VDAGRGVVRTPNVSVLGVARTWGTTPAERARPYPCDRWLDPVDDAYYRGITVHAEPAAVFRWLCQLKVAPYSYDWIDNLGRQSPRVLTPGVERLASGDRFMTIFTLVEFEPDRHVTMRLENATLFPALVLSYVVDGMAPGTSRLVMKFVVRYPAGIGGRLQRWLLPWGDLVMARRQLMNLRDLAERRVGA
jgi:hypothetical protein